VTDTGLDLVTDVLQDLGAVVRNETPASDDAALVLQRVNDLLDAWNVDLSTVYRVAQISHTFTVSQGSYTIGTAGGEDISQTRPIRILRGSFVRDANGSDLPLVVLAARAEYDAIATKSSASTYPRWLYYDPAFPSGTIYYWEVPDTALTAYLNVPAALSALALSDTLVFPPGYRRALRMNAALDCMDAFGASLSPRYERQAQVALAKIKGNNLRRQRAVRFPARLRGRRYPRSAAEVQAGEYL